MTKKPVIMGLNIEDTLKNKLGTFCTAEWKQKGILYLGTKISVNPQGLLEQNVITYIKRMENQLRN